MDGSHLTATIGSRSAAHISGYSDFGINRPGNRTFDRSNYNASKADRRVMRTGLKKMLEFIVDTKDGQAIVDKETIADRWTPQPLT